MNKTLREILFFCMLISMLFLAGCASSKQVVEENPFDFVEPRIDAKTKKPYDFNGTKIIIGDWYTDPEAEPKSSAEKELKAWNEWTNKTYNVEIERKKLWGAPGYFEMVKNYCVEGYITGENSRNSGYKESYVFVIDESIAQQGVRAGLFYDLSTIGNISYYDSVKYNMNSVKRLSRGLSYYSFGWEKNEPLSGVYFNKRILQDYGYTSEYIYDLQASGKWTWTEFERLCNLFTKDTDYDGDTDIYAMSSDMIDFATLCLDSNDTGLVCRDINGKYYSNVINPKTMEAFEWMERIWRKHQYPKKYGDGDDYFYKPFIEGKTAFLVGHQNREVANASLQKMNDDYGFVCFPLGPYSSGTYRTVSNAKMVVIPSWYGKERVEKIAKALDLWLIPVPTNSTSDAWKRNYANLFRDSRASDETLTLMAASPNPRIDSLLIGYPYESMVYNILNGINTLEEEHFFTKFGIESLLEDNNRYSEKKDIITKEEFEEREELERAKIQVEIAESEENLADDDTDEFVEDIDFFDEDGLDEVQSESENELITENQAENDESQLPIEEVSKKTKKKKDKKQE